jgi:hypothetical protein
MCMTVALRSLKVLVAGPFYLPSFQQNSPPGDKETGGAAAARSFLPNFSHDKGGIERTGARYVFPSLDLFHP